MTDRVKLTEEWFQTLNPDGSYQVIVDTDLKQQILEDQEKAVKWDQYYDPDKWMHLEEQIKQLKQDLAIHHKNFNEISIIVKEQDVKLKEIAKYAEQLQYGDKSVISMELRRMLGIKDA